jgi:glutathione S-transferase
MADELVFYTNPMSRGRIVRWMLEEIGRPYRTELLDYGTTMKAPAYLAINPMGKVPALRHGDSVVTEAAAICCYLADAFPQAGLAVPIGDPRRGAYLKWLFFGPSCVEPAVADKAFTRAEPPPRSALGYGDYDTVMDVLAGALRSGPYLLGQQFTAADVVIGSGLRWGMAFKLIPERQEFTAYTARLATRPALKRAQAKDAELIGAPDR